MAYLVLSHFLAASIGPLLTRFLGRRAFLVLALAPAGSLVWLLLRTTQVRDGAAPPTEQYSWVPAFGLQLDFSLSSLQWILAVLVTGVGALILLYCTWYFHEDDPGLWRFGAVFTYFAGAMLGLVLSDNIVLLCIFWELTTVFSYLLVGHNPVRSANRRAAMQALLVTTLGGLSMLAGAVAIGETSSYRISEILQSPPPASALTTVAVMLLLVGAITKSAQVPFPFWLPGAMAAPTPVSAYLHAAAMVKAGIFLVTLFAPVFATVPGWRPLMITLGCLTMLVGGWRALQQTDIKLLLAFGTVSQLGFMMTLAAIGTQATALAAVGLVIGHALFKSALFLTVGVIDHSTGTRDLRQLSGLARRMPLLTAAAVLAVLSMAGLPPMMGFVAKESALEALLHADVVLGGWAYVVLAAIVLGSMLTVAYSARFVWGAFARKHDVPDTELHRPGTAFQLSPVILALLSLAAGLSGAWLTTVIVPYAETAGAGADTGYLALWHGLNLPLALSAVSIAGGALLFWRRDDVRRLYNRMPHPLDAERSYNWAIRTLDRTAVELTARTQQGSLPVYVATIFTVVILLPGVAAATALTGSDLRAWDSPVQVGATLIIAIGTLLAARARERIPAVLFVSVTGYGLALLFLVHGAPDLALTQIAVETVTLVVFVLVLRRLPQTFRTPVRVLDTRLRAAIAIGVGLTATALIISSTNARHATPDSATFVDAAYEIGNGKNAVNVTLVDIRAWDTLGEVAVILAAATGVASLVFTSTRRGRIERVRDLSDDQSHTGADDASWLSAGALIERARRSTILEVSTRLLFHVLIVTSLFLLFAGHNLPGGGFAGGLVAGVALLVRYLAAGRHELDEALPLDAGLLAGLGLLIIIATGLAPVLSGGAILQSEMVELHVPWVWNDIKVVSPVFFDIGVYLIVVGLFLDIGRSLGSGVDRQAAEDESLEAMRA
ncbi:Na+/H+ antiporter subunit A [Blastococcus sp. Marseille-P5729]|uniref:Na+/H+ antiporter subunit A n=1 Tax=Blastococcus sp. Marseille-P5729 TaxID=2086582 RepID=UPI000D114B87|nr:Na+/H+ antiporter subunit A [Blastococcus sp. Marseille-P5729]